MHASLPNGTQSLVMQVVSICSHSSLAKESPMLVSESTVKWCESFWLWGGLEVTI